MKKKTISQTLVFLFLLVFALIITVPFLIIAINSLKPAREAALFSLKLPATLFFKNYTNVFSHSKILRGFMNSFILSISTVVLVNLFAAMAGFAIQRQASRLYKTIYYIFLFGLVVPISIIPTIKLMMTLKIHNTYPGIILYYVAINMPFALFLFTGFMKSIPRELDESVFVDGGSYLRLFAQIILPLLRTPIITATIVVMVNVWNDFMGPFYLISDSKKWTVILNVFYFNTMYETDWGALFAFMFVVILPLLIIYFSLQKYIITGLTAGSLKG